MEIVSLIFNGLTLAAAVTVVVLLIQEKKASKRRDTAALNFLIAELRSCSDAAEDTFEEHFREIKQAHEKDGLCQKDIRDSITALNRFAFSDIEVLRKRIKDLEDGIIPDYNAAMAAKNQVDEFSAGVMAILTHGNPVKKSDKDEEDGDV